MKKYLVVALSVLLAVLFVYSCTNSSAPKDFELGDKFDISNKLGVSGMEEDFVPGEYVVQIENSETAIRALSNL